MNSTTITLDERHFEAVSQKARELGTTPAEFIHSLIDAATLGFDEILSPVRNAFGTSGASEEDLDEAINEARLDFYKRTRGDAGT